MSLELFYQISQTRTSRERRVRELEIEFTDEYDEAQHIEDHLMND